MKYKYEISSFSISTIQVESHKLTEVTNNDTGGIEDELIWREFEEQPFQINIMLQSIFKNEAN